jgi:Zn-dependent protease with chaperone function
MLRAFLAQSILHALVAAMLVEALLRVWRIGDGAWRLRLRLLALAAPLVWLPALFLLAPARSTAPFADHRALFASERWNLVTVGGEGLGNLCLLLAAGLGSVLFLRDALPPLLDLLRGGAAAPSPGPWQSAGAIVERLAARYASGYGAMTPEVRVVRAGGPILLCEGARRPSLVVSTATVSLLAPDELEAAIAHEVAHAAFRDPAWGFGLLAARALLFFNPAAQWVSRAMVDDVERRADQAAVRLTGKAEPLTRAIARLFRENHQPPRDSNVSFERLFWRVRRAGVDRRCRRLLADNDAEAVVFGRLRMVLAGAAVLGVTFLVV